MSVALVHFIAGPSAYSRHPSAILRVEAVSSQVGAELVQRVGGLAQTQVAKRHPGTEGAIAALAERLLVVCGASLGPARIRGDRLIVPVSGAAMAELVARAVAMVVDAPFESWGELLAAATTALVFAYEAPPEAAMLADAARRRGIPVRWPSPGVLWLGDGARARSYTEGRLSGLPAMTAILDDKRATAAFIGRLGLPVPVHVAVEDTDQAEAAASALGYPVVVKPASAKNQVGVFLGLRSGPGVRHAFEQARAAAGALGGAILVEKQVEGVYLRATVVGGKLGAVLTSETPVAAADGTSTTEELLRAAWGGGSGPLDPRTRAVFDALAYAEGLAPGDVPVKGRIIRVGLANHGATADVTERVHPTWRAALERIGLAVGHSVIGIDLLVTAVDAALDPARDAVLEVNAAPAFGLHARVGAGEPRPLADAVLSTLDLGRATVVVGSADAIEAIARSVPGMAGYTRGHAWIGSPEQIVGAGGHAAHALALHPSVRRVGVEIDALMAREVGFPFEHVDHVCGAIPRGFGELVRTLSGGRRPQTQAAVIRTLLRG